MFLVLGFGFVGALYAQDFVEQPVEKRPAAIVRPTILCADTADALNRRLSVLAPGAYELSGLTTSLVRGFSDYGTFRNDHREMSICVIASPKQQ